MTAATSLSPSAYSMLTSAKSVTLLEDLPLFSCGRTSPESSTPQTMPLDVFWRDWPEKMTRSDLQGANGSTLVMCVDPSVQSLGGPSTPNISSWHNDANVCSLSEVLVPHSIPQRYYLSSMACGGILNRAGRRGKELPTMLRRALQAVADAPNEPEIPEDKIQS